MTFVIPEPATARTSVRRLPTGENPYIPAPARIMQVRELTPDVRLYDLRFTDPALAEKFSWRPGQFVMLSVLGVGEAPFSLPSSPTRRGTFQLGIRRAGAMTGYLCDHIAEGDLVGVRGPLGHGFPVAVGTALAGRLDGSERRTFVLCGDGELQEGSMWEAAMAGAHFGLERLTLIVDRNGLQQGDATETTMRLDPLAERFGAFGWAVHEVDGHDHAALLEAFTALPIETGKPSCLIAHTHKGHGVSFISDQVAWHHHVPTADEYARARAELETQLADAETQLAALRAQPPKAATQAQAVSA